MLYSASASAKVMDTHHRSSPLVQEGLEIPVEVTVEMPTSEKNKLAIKKFQELVREKYKEPVDNKFEDVTGAILARLKCNEQENSDSSHLEFDLIK